MGRQMLVQREGASSREIIDRKLDVGTGTFFSNFVMYFIILTAAVTLHNHGMTKIETSKQAAEALRPLAGSLAYFLYTAGLIGVDLLAIPTLTGQPPMPSPKRSSGRRDWTDHLRAHALFTPCSSPLLSSGLRWIF